MDRFANTDSWTPWSTLVSLLAIFTVAIVVALVLLGFVRNEMLYRDAELTQQMVQSVATAQDQKLTFSDDPSGYQQLEKFLNQVLQFPDVLRGNIYSKNGTVIWSSEKSLEGQSYSDNEELMRAIRGELIVEVGRSTEFEKAEQKLFNWRLTQSFTEIYIPIRDNGRIAAVVELYKVPQSLASAITSTAWVIWACTLLVATMLSWFLLRSRSRVADRAVTHSSFGGYETEIEPVDVGRSSSVYIDNDSLTADITNEEVSKDAARLAGVRVDREAISAVGDMAFDEQWETVLDSNSRQRQFDSNGDWQKWLVSAVVLLVVVAVPIVMGTTLLYRHGINPDSPLAGLTSTDKSPIHFFASTLTLLMHGDSDSSEEETPATEVDSKVGGLVVGEDTQQPFLVTGTERQPSVDDPVHEVQAPPTANADIEVAKVSSDVEEQATRTVDKGDVPEILATDEPASVASLNTDAGVNREVHSDGTQLQLEMMFWSSIADSNDQALYAAYLDKYPDGNFAAIARTLSAKKSVPSTKIQNDRYIQLAWQAFSRRSLTTPEEDNAVRWAKLSLELAPEDDQARRVLQGVIDTYLDWSLRAEAARRPIRAAHYFSLAQSLYEYASAEQVSTLLAIDRNMNTPVVEFGADYTSTSNEDPVRLLDSGSDRVVEENGNLQALVSQLRQRLSKLDLHRRQLPYMTN